MMENYYERKLANVDGSDTAIHTVPELETLLPPLTETEKAGLEKDILARGVLSALVTWNGILVDGHHRLEICKKHDIPFHTHEISFNKIEEAKYWAWQHQESQRNLTAYQRAEIALKLKPQIAAKAKERQVRKPADSVVATLPQQNSTTKTRDELADIAKLGGRTIDKVEFLDKNADEKTKEKLRSGDTTINAEFKRLKKEKGQKERELNKRAECLVFFAERN